MLKAFFPMVSKPSEGTLAVAWHMAYGDDYQTTAKLLHVPYGTVDSRLVRLREQLGVHTTGQAVQICLDNGWMPEP